MITNSEQGSGNPLLSKYYIYLAHAIGKEIAKERRKNILLFIEEQCNKFVLATMYVYMKVVVSHAVEDELPQYERKCKYSFLVVLSHSLCSVTIIMSETRMNQSL